VELGQGTVEDLDLNPAFWRGKKVFLTGHTGFKGGWLSLWLDALGADVTGYALPAPSQPSFFETARVASTMNSIMGDVRDPAALASAASQCSPDIVIHMAAQALVRPSYEDPAATYSSNVMGTVNVLEAARALPGLQAVVIVTSDKCYENSGAGRSYREDDRLGGRDPYSNSKACAELVTAAYRESFFAGKRGAIATARAGNVIGGGDWAADRLVPDAMRAFRAGRPVRLRYPHATRPWQHVLDPLRGYLLLAERLCSGESGWAEPWNFGPARDSVTTVEAVVEALAAKWGGGASWEPDTVVNPHEARDLGIDPGKAQARLGWKSRLDLAQTIDWTVEWYRGWSDGADMRRLSEAQLERYRGLAAA
jgi:CDP-glucose 4,6-dehydratase